MSADLLAEFDSFYQAPQDVKKETSPPSNDLSFLANTSISTAENTRGASHWQIPVSQPSQDIWQSLTEPPTTTVPQPAVPQDDVWGSFEAAATTPPPEQSSVWPTFANPGQYNAGTTTTPARERRPIVERRDTLEIFSNHLSEEGRVRNNRSMQSNLPARLAPTRKSSSGGDILFDADDPSDEDDFGDFETGASPELADPSPSIQSLEGMFGATTINANSAYRSKPPTNLLSIAPAASNEPLPYPQAPKSPSFKERNPFAELGLKTNSASDSRTNDEEPQPSPVTAWPTFEPTHPKPEPYHDSPIKRDAPDDEWGDFADMPTQTLSKSATKVTPGIEADAWGWDTVDGIEEVDSSASRVDLPPPTNIPPPSVLLALFPALIDLPGSSLFKPVANQQFSLKNRILSDPSTIEFLRSYLLIATVAARIIAGRKLRWKRDKILSQAMKMGPAAAGGKGGMKLAGIDKAEIVREEREAADVVRAWKDQLGRLRSAVAIANSSLQDTSSHLAIPDISEVLHVKKQDGAMTAPKPCLVCGLERGERINKVDVQVEDSFGEFWTEHWGHTVCRNFWLEHESKLRHR